MGILDDGKLDRKALALCGRVSVSCVGKSKSCANYPSLGNMRTSSVSYDPSLVGARFCERKSNKLL